ncbi:MAG: DUF6263 family protein [Fimbriimonas sp.]
MQLKKLVTLGSLGLLLAATASAQITKSGSTYNFKMKFTKGQVIKYSIDVKNQMGGPSGQTMQMAIPMSQTVKSVSGGTATISMTLGPIQSGGREMMKAQTQEMQMDSAGKPVGGGKGMTSNFSSLPSKPVRVGETWTASVDINAGVMPAKAQGTYTFVGVKKVKGVEVAEIAVKLTGQGGPKISGTGTTLLRVADGSIEATNLNIQTSVANPQSKEPMQISQVIKVTRG